MDEHNWRMMIASGRVRRRLKRQTLPEGLEDRATIAVLCGEEEEDGVRCDPKYPYRYVV